MMVGGGGEVEPWTFGALLLTVTKCKNKYNVQINIILNSTKKCFYTNSDCIKHQSPFYLLCQGSDWINQNHVCFHFFFKSFDWENYNQSFDFKMYYYNVQSLFSDFSDEKRTSLGFGLGSSVISVLIAPVCPSNHSSSENHNT